MGLEEEIEALEQEISDTPYNKSTEQHIGRLKAKLADKKEELERRQSSSGGGGGYAVEQTGDATVALVGYPSVGKSTLINALTNADSDVGAYDFTTLDVNPGMLKYRGAAIQLLDVPGLIAGASAGRGGGREVLSVIRTADLLLVMISAFEVEQYESITRELYDNKIRPDADPPSISISKKGKGGIDVNASEELHLDYETIREVLRERGFVNADVTIRGDPDIDELVDGVMDNRVYLPTQAVVNKVDLVEASYMETVRENMRAAGIDPSEALFISAETEAGLEELKERLWTKLGLIRIYMDKPGRGIDYEEPVILREGQTVDDALENLGGTFDERFRFARVTGSSAKHDAQQVGRDHVLKDEDVLRIVARR